MANDRSERSDKNDKSEFKTVLITGGGSGIGLETARLLLERGPYRVVLLGRDRNKLEAASEFLLQSTGTSPQQVGVQVCDLRRADQITKTLERILVGCKNIYGLVNNAGIYPFGGVADTTESIWDEAMDVNLKAPFLLTQAVAPCMAKNENGGRIINVSSTAGLLPNQSALAYSVSKAAVVHLTKALAKELGKDKITVNCVCPGIVRSPLHESYHSSDIELEEFYVKRGASLPLGRVGESRDVAAAIRFFLSDEASWVTGDIFVMDGGRLLL
ncbi:SDR family oxidoreductase [Bdellovibrionota bacterium FG-2]